MNPALREVSAATVQLELPVQGVLRDVKSAFHGLCVQAGKAVLAAMMDADRTALRRSNRSAGWRQELGKTLSTSLMSVAARPQAGPDECRLRGSPIHFDRSVNPAASNPSSYAPHPSRGEVTTSAATAELHPNSYVTVWVAAIHRC
jgi:hypothetical protein